MLIIFDYRITTVKGKWRFSLPAHLTSPGKPTALANTACTFAYSLFRKQQKLAQKNYFQNGIPDSSPSLAFASRRRRMGRKKCNDFI
jgi:hypothetical protein